MNDIYAHFSFGSDGIKLQGVPCFDPFLSADCGQAFRWEAEGNKLTGVVDGRTVRLFKIGEDEYLLKTDRAFFEERLIDYFDLRRDYESILAGYDDKWLKEAVSSCPGIRILRQDAWETLCSFIISQNNNIPRIKGIIGRLCESFGSAIDQTHFSFPPAQKLAPLEVEDLAPLRAGFRAKYILDAARKVASGEIDLKKIEKMPLDEAEEELKKIKGVGKKVAQCTLLFGFGRLDAFPEDVWVKRIMAELYPKGLPPCTKGTGGIAQQYLFQWYRTKDKND